MVGSGTRKARAISSVVRPPSRRSVSAMRASVESTGWQAVNTRRNRSSPIVIVERGIEIWLRHLLLDLELVTELLMFSFEQLVAAEEIDRSMLRARHQPSAGPFRDARFGPLLERRDEGLLRQLLGNADVAHHAGETGDQLRLLDPKDGIDGAVCVGSRHRLPTNAPSFDTASASRVRPRPPAPRGLGRTAFRLAQRSGGPRTHPPSLEGASCADP